MPQFKDSKGRTWMVEGNVANLVRVRTLLKLDLMEIIEGKILHDLYRNPATICDVLYVMCKPQADRQSITDEDFGSAMGGDSLDAGLDALLQAIPDFFTKGDRQNVQEILTKTTALLTKTTNHMKARLQEISPDAVLAHVLASLPPNVGTSSGSAPESPASTQTPEPSAS